MHEIENARTAVHAVGRDIVAASRSADQAAEASARCIATLLEQRREGDLPLDLALDELDLLAVALRSQLTARADLVRARLALVRVPRRLGIEGFGPSCPCDQSSDRRPSGRTPELRVA